MAELGQQLVLVHLNEEFVGSLRHSNPIAHPRGPQGPTRCLNQILKYLHGLRKVCDLESCSLRKKECRDALPQQSVPLAAQDRDPNGWHYALLRRSAVDQRCWKPSRAVIFDPCSWLAIQLVPIKIGTWQIAQQWSRVLLTTDEIKFNISESSRNIMPMKRR